MAITGKRKRYILILLALAVCFFLSSVFTLTIGASAEKREGTGSSVPVPEGCTNLLGDLDVSKFIFLQGVNAGNTTFADNKLSFRKNAQPDAPLNGFYEGFACFHSMQPLDFVQDYVFGATISVGECYDAWTYRAASLVFMSNHNYNKYYQYAIWRDKIVLVDQPSGTVLVDIPFTRIDNRSYEVEIRVSGNRITVYQDGEKMIDDMELGTVYGNRVGVSIGYAEADVGNFYLYSSQPQAEEDNLAYYRHAESNFGSAAGYEPWKAVDGRNASRWASVYDETDRPDTENPLTFTVDLGAEKQFSKLVLTEYMNGDEFTSRMVNFEVQVRSDISENWKTVKSIGSGDTGERGLQDYITTIYLDEPVSARYVQLYITKVTFPPTLIEFELYNIEPSAPVAQDVTVTGKTAVGETLYGNYTYFDANNDPEGNTRFEWSRSESADGPFEPISSETGRTYSVKQSDANCYIKFSVYPQAEGEESGDVAYESLPVLIDGRWLEQALSAYDPAWRDPGSGEMDSVPLGNGDVGANVWINEKGEVEFYISKTDAFDNNGRLIKIGKVVVSLSNNPFVAGSEFFWRLHLNEATIEINGKDNTKLVMWIDANHPSIEMSISGDVAFSAKVRIDPWRTVERQITSDGLAGWGQGESEPWNYNEQIEHADTIVDTEGALLWYYRNTPPIASNGPQLLNRTMGAVISGDSFKKIDNKTLQASGRRAVDFSVTVLTDTTDFANTYVNRLLQLHASVGEESRTDRKEAHDAYWENFWNESYIYVTGASDAYEITRGYILQRYMNGCAGRGLPIKFNGSIFNVAEKDGYSTPDYRLWGGGYWWQNTRLIYWPMLASGDFELMKPLFKMYSDELQNAIDAMSEGMGYVGAALFEEGSSFGKGTYRTQIDNNGDNAGPALHAYYQIMELSSMMLKYYEYTGDSAFLKDEAIPMAQAGLNFYYQNFSRDLSGKLNMYPTDGLETYYNTTNSLVEVAAIHENLQMLLDLPVSETTAAQRAQWEEMLSAAPDIPTRLNADGQEMLSPAETYDHLPRNVENPELYAIFPFELYGLGRPDLAFATRAFDSRLNTATGSWQTDAIFAAQVGKTQEARQLIYANYTYRSGERRFAGFLDGGFDWAPGQNGGNVASIALQKMVMQAVGEKILIAPALPEDWNVEFKLAAPQNTVVEASYVNGEIKDLKVTPASREADVFIVGQDRDKAYDVELPEKEISLYEGSEQTVDLRLVNCLYEPVDGELEWSSNAPAVVTVENGILFAHGVGEAVISVRSGDVSGQFTVRVNERISEAIPASIRVGTDTLELKLGDSVTISADVLDASGNKIDGAKILWESTDHNIAKVENGTVIALRGGTTQITLRCENVVKTVQVTVTAPPVKEDLSYLYALIPLCIVTVGIAFAGVILFSKFRSLKR